MKDLMSEVEIKKDLVEAGMILTYSDMNNYMTYTILDVDNESFECIDNETKEEEVYFFDELQIGWNFKENDFNKYIARVA